jgi:hypothetical protein
MKKWIAGFVLISGMMTMVQAQVNPTVKAPEKSKTAEPPNAQAPQNIQGIRMLADGRGDTILLRWAPSTPFLWQMGNKYGYILERFVLKEDSVMVPATARKRKLLTPTPLMPASKARFDSIELTDDRAAIVKEAIYGDEFKLETSIKGGTGVLHKSQELDNRFGFSLLICDISPVSAKAAALSFTDTDVKPGNRYIYRVKLGKAIPNFNYEPGIIVVDGKENFKANIISDLNGTFSDKAAILKWSVFLHEGVYSAYIIEKSEDGQHFKNISSEPLITTSEKKNQEYAYFVDSLADNTRQYYYRIRGITPFGVTGPPSNVFAGKGKEEMTTLTIVDSTTVLRNEKVRLSWHLDNPMNQAIKGFYVLRASKDEGPYKQLNATLLPKDVFTYTDPSPERSNYYRVKTVLANDDISLSFSHLALLIDSVPPVLPSDLAGTIDSLGIVRIKWTSNKEEDLLGYRVFRSNNQQEEFVEVTRNILARPAFKDTVNINTLTSKVYYKVIAIDQHFNASAYSAALELKRPDTIPPAPPVFGQIRRADTTIRLTFVSGHADDLAKQVLYRQRKSSDSATKLAEWAADKAPSEFTDRQGLHNGEVYIYRLEAHDSTGNIAKALSGEVFYETGIRKPIDQVTAKAEREKRLIALQWKYPETGIRKMIIYRNKQGEPATIYQTLNENPGNFEDKELTINNTYVYKIQAIFNGGAKSPISKDIVVKY